MARCGLLSFGAARQRCRTRDMLSFVRERDLIRRQPGQLRAPLAGCRDQRLLVLAVAHHAHVRPRSAERPGGRTAMRTRHTEDFMRRTRLRARRLAHWLGWGGGCEMGAAPAHLIGTPDGGRAVVAPRRRAVVHLRMPTLGTRRRQRLGRCWGGGTASRHEIPPGRPPGLWGGGRGHCPAVSAAHPERSCHPVESCSFAATDVGVKHCED